MTDSPRNLIQTADDCAAFVDRVGVCGWRRFDRLASLPSIEAESPWDGDTGALMNQTWFWKDDLHIAKRVFYGPLLAGHFVFVSMELLPSMIAAQGDNDPRTLFEQGRLASNALQVFEHIARQGPTATNAIAWPSGSRHLYLTALQQKFLLTKHGLTGRTRGTYGYVWGECQPFFPDAFERAARIAVPDARAAVAARLAVPESVAGKLLKWH